MAEKTEKPTPKRVKDSAKKGQSFKSKDLVTTAVVLAGLSYLHLAANFDAFIEFYQWVALENSQLKLQDFLIKLVEVFFRIALPMIVVCMITGMLMTLLQTKFVIAIKALKLNFKALNPIQGFKRLFSLRTVKELVKSVLYLAVFILSYWIVARSELQAVLSWWQLDLAGFVALWGALIFKMVIVFIGCGVPVLLMDYLAEFYLFLKELKMDKHEVKQEYKESEGNPEIKYTRKRTHMELLNSEERAAIGQSEVVLANPTHIAVAIYFNPDIAMLPFITLRCKNAKARAVIAYAESIGIPVVRSVPLARGIYFRYQRYSFISLNDDLLLKLMEVLIWLRQVEQAESEPVEGGTPPNEAGNNAS